MKTQRKTLKQREKHRKPLFFIAVEQKNNENQWFSLFFIFSLFFHVFSLCFIVFLVFLFFLSPGSGPLPLAFLFFYILKP